MKKVSIITVNFNQAGVTLALLQSIQQTNTYADTEIIVVDNGSQENPQQAIAQQYADVKFIRSDRNLGFAGGNNLGINAATGDYFFLVNNDTEFTPGLIQKLVDVLDAHPEVGAVSPRINYFNDKTLIQYAGFTRVNFYTCRNYAVGKFKRDEGQFDEVCGPTAYAHGAAMMVKREATAKAGLMFENYFLYFEEIDWCERILRAGYQIWMRGDAVIYHKESVSVGKKSVIKEYFMNRNRILFTRRNAPLLAKPVFYIYFMLMVVPRNIISYVKAGDKQFIGVLLKAIGWNLTHSRNSADLGITLKTT
ncbi:hypothetical protein C8P68_101176 [Mucilaginibacter yixingensis]|uniref:Glycosyltransferase 2-like domain-containing protein n=1 Tax=Mucilaginibacter yixingensis TaxID=1295612 RepID=A0A2T5JF31_9SPHI|nr:glycosyltransferase family 2 protein [Mucilaginibacter yixingensis]PTR00946.1 hypothetical protein C8P68_101176 [Mucilaginibacter yixingensis]